MARFPELLARGLRRPMGQIMGDMAAEARRVHEIGDGVLTLVDTLPAAPMPKPATHERIVGGEKKAPKTSAAGGGGRRMARNGRAAAMFVPK